MKTKHFYSYMVEKTHLTLEIGDLSISSEERVELLSLADANIHTHVIHVVLNNLTPEDKKIFLKNMVSGNHKETWKHLLSKIDDIEVQIQDVINKEKEELLEDLKKVKKLNKK